MNTLITQVLTKHELAKWDYTKWEITTAFNWDVNASE